MSGRHYSSPLRGTAFLVLLIVLGGLFAACGGSDDDDSDDAASVEATSSARAGSASTVTPVATGASSPTPGAAGGLQEKALTAGLPRTVNYSDADWTVTAARVSNESPQTAIDPAPPKPGDEFFAYFTVTVKNLLNTQDQRFDLAAFTLRIPGGSGVAAARPAGWPTSHSVKAGQASDIVLAFPVAAGTELQGAALVLGEPGFVAAELPLSGPAPANPYPVSFANSGAPTDVTSGNPCGTPMRVELLSGETDLDAGIDIRGLGGAIEGPRRAGNGQRFVRFALRTTGISGQCGGANVMSAVFRLEIAGTPRGAYNVVNQALSNGEALDVVVGYRVPENIRDVVLIVGAPDKTTVRYPVTLP